MSFVEAVGDSTVDGSDTCFIHFHHFAVVGHQTVHFSFHVRGLCVDSGGEGSAGAVLELYALCHSQHGFALLYVGVGEFVGILVIDVGGGIALYPAVTFDMTAKTAIFAKHDGAGGVV